MEKHSIQNTPFIFELSDMKTYHNESSEKFLNFKSTTIKGSIIESLKKLSFASEKDAIIFLFNLSRDLDFAKKFIDEIIDNPNKTSEIISVLLSLFNSNSKEYLELWLNDETYGYKSSFNYYINKYWAKAKSLESLVKISPNIAPWSLIGKANELNINCITLGDVPKDLGGNINEYIDLIEKIMNSDFYNSYLNAKNSETNQEYCQKIAKENGIKQSDTMCILKEINKTLSKNTKPFKIKSYIIEPIIRSYSAKLIFSITANNNHYILKINPYYCCEENQSDKIRKGTENAFMRADMPYSNAMIDFYLKLNKSSNAPDILFYHSDTDSTLYKSTDTSEETFKISDIVLNNLFLVRNNSYFDELKQLGILVNDVNSGNFIISKDNRAVLIDSGHISYNHPLRPTVPGINYTLSNLCGREYTKL